MSVSENSGTPKSSILIGFSIINHPFWGTFIFGNTHIVPHRGANVFVLSLDLLISFGDNKNLLLECMVVRGIVGSN